MVVSIYTTEKTKGISMEVTGFDNLAKTSWLFFHTIANCSKQVEKIPHKWLSGSGLLSAVDLNEVGSCKVLNDQM